MRNLWVVCVFLVKVKKKTTTGLSCEKHGYVINKLHNWRYILFLLPENVWFPLFGRMFNGISAIFGPTHFTTSYIGSTFDVDNRVARLSLLWHFRPHILSKHHKPSQKNGQNWCEILTPTISTMNCTYIFSSSCQHPIFQNSIFTKQNLI